jgi:MFS family permease
MRAKLRFLLLNIAHFLDHLFMLIFATLAALVLSGQWQLTYAELIVYATPGFVAFGAFALPAGWLADRWSRHGMMVVFFVGIGLSSIVCALAQTPLQMSIGLFFVGTFAAIYHPVGIALVLGSHRRDGMMVAINGVWGNMGVACAALATAFFIETGGWRSAFIVPGVVSVILGLIYFALHHTENSLQQADQRGQSAPRKSKDNALPERHVLIRVFAVVFLTTALGGLVFQSTTFALPKVLDERVTAYTDQAMWIGKLAFLAFFAGSAGQLIVGYLLDRVAVKRVFLSVAALQVVFFSIAIQAVDKVAIVAAIGYMLAAFGQIPINDVLVGRVSRPEYRSRVLGIRYTITITVMACAIPLIAAIHQGQGFAALFKVLAVAAAIIFFIVLTLPSLRLLNHASLRAARH